MEKAGERGAGGPEIDLSEITIYILFDIVFKNKELLKKYVILIIVFDILTLICL